MSKCVATRIPFKSKVIWKGLTSKNISKYIPTPKIEGVSSKDGIFKRWGTKNTTCFSIPKEGAEGILTMERPYKN
jgi:hypothetical protein